MASVRELMKARQQKWAGWGERWRNFEGEGGVAAWAPVAAATHAQAAELLALMCAPAPEPEPG